MSNLMPHIKIEEINSLSEDESCLLLGIVNLWAPIQPPMPSEKDPYPITLNIVRYAHRESIVDRIKQSVKVVKKEFFPIYEGLCSKLSIPVEKPPVEKEKECVDVKEDKKVEETPINDTVIPPSNTEISGSVENK